MKVLFLSPHPDDVEIGCGGTMARFSREGHEVHVAVVAGDLGGAAIDMVHSGKSVQFQERTEEQLSAAQKLGVSQVHFLGLGEASRFDAQPMARYVTKFDSLFLGFDQLYVPLPSHAKDHLVVWEAALAALRPTKLDSLQVYGYEQPTQWHGPQVSGAINCRHYVRLQKEDFDKKMSALRCFKSQMGGRESSLVGLAGPRTLAELRGLEVGAEYAEMFLPLRTVI